MAFSLAITIDGVLAEQGLENSFAASKVVNEGLMLYRSLSAIGPVSLVSLQGQGDAQFVEHWLKAHGLDAHTHLLYDPHPSDPLRGVAETLATLRRMGPLDFVVEANARRAAHFIHLGVPTFLFSKPAYSRAEFRPDSFRAPREWDSVIAELDEQKGLLTEDRRTADEVAGQRFEDA